MPYQLINILDKRKYKLLCSDMYDSDIFKMNDKRNNKYNIKNF